MDTVLGVSMAPKTVRMVLVEGETGDGATVDEDGFDFTGVDDQAATSGPDQVISAILGTREGAAESGYDLRSTGVTWTDPVEAAALRDALAQHKVENVMLVSAFLAAAALAQQVGSATGYDQTALLFVEPETATLAVVDSTDGSITEVQRQPLHSADRVAELAAMASGAETLTSRPDGLFVVGSDVDIAPIKPALEAATSLVVSAPEEPQTALARGAALAAASAPLFSSSTAALAYAKDPGTGAIDPYAVAPGYFDVAADSSGEEALAYSAVPDDEDDAYTEFTQEPDSETGYRYVGVGRSRSVRRTLTLISSAVAAILVVGAAAVAIVMAIGGRPTTAVQSNPGQHGGVPQQAPAPAPAASAPPAAAPAPAPAPEAPATAPVPEAPAPASVAPAPAPQAPAQTQVPEAPAPTPEAPAPASVAPAPVPEAPAPASVAPAPAPVAPAPVTPVPVAPIPVPIIIPAPIAPQQPGIFGPPVQGPARQPWGGDHGDGGWGHGGGFPGGGGRGGFGIPGLGR